MCILNPIQCAAWLMGVILGLNVLVMALFVLFAKVSEGKLKAAMRNIIFELDKITSNMENSEKRNKAIQEIREFLGWRRIFIPVPLIGWVIDTEVATIRKIQQYTYSQNRITMRQITLSELTQVTSQSKSALQSAAQESGRGVKVYLHWSAGHYGQFFDEYHINIDHDGSVYLSNDGLGKRKSHTYNRNAGAIGISLACCYGATTEDFGKEPPTPIQIEAMSQVIAVLCRTLELPITLCNVMTHAEAANNLDGVNPSYEKNGYPDGKYGPGFSCERWDLWFIPGARQGEGGNILRGKAIWYQYNGLDF